MSYMMSIALNDVLYSKYDQLNLIIGKRYTHLYTFKYCIYTLNEGCG